MTEPMTESIMGEYGFLEADDEVMPMAEEIRRLRAEVRKVHQNWDDDREEYTAEVERLNEQISHLSHSYLQMQAISAEYQDKKLALEAEVERLKELSDRGWAYVRDFEKQVAEKDKKLAAHEEAMREALFFLKRMEGPMVSETIDVLNVRLEAK